MYCFWLNYLRSIFFFFFVIGFHQHSASPDSRSPCLRTLSPSTYPPVVNSTTPPYTHCPHKLRNLAVIHVKPDYALIVRENDASPVSPMTVNCTLFRRTLRLPDRRGHRRPYASCRSRGSRRFPCSRSRRRPASDRWGIQAGPVGLPPPPGEAVPWVPMSGEVFDGLVNGGLGTFGLKVGLTRWDVDGGRT